jgi:hypothetical protein
MLVLCIAARMLLCLGDEKQTRRGIRRRVIQEIFEREHQNQTNERTKHQHLQKHCNLFKTGNRLMIKYNYLCCIHSLIWCTSETSNVNC